MAEDSIPHYTAPPREWAEAPMSDARSMIERVKAAIASEVKRQDADGLLTNLYPYETGDGSISIEGSVELAPLARAVLTAMREPTEWMVKRGAEAACDGATTRAPSIYEPMAEDGYKAMIDAALADERS